MATRLSDVDVGRLLAGCDTIIWRELPGFGGVRVGVVPLTPADYESLRQRTDPTHIRVGTRELIARTVVAADESGSPAPLFSSSADLADVDAALVDALTALVDDAHLGVHGVPAGLTAGRLVDELDRWAGAQPTWIERVRARHATSLVAYYGLPSARHATTWQVLAFARLMTAEDDG